jgi:hypothetical protein
MSKQNQNNTKQESQGSYKLDFDNQCPNCGHFSYRSEYNPSGCMAYIAIFVVNLMFWYFINYITSEIFEGVIGTIALCTFILMCIFKKKIMPTKKKGDVIEYTCSNCNYKNSHQLL